MSHEELLPCPFCGGKPALSLPEEANNDIYYKEMCLYCCDTTIKKWVYFDCVGVSDEEISKKLVPLLIKEWNTRTPAQPQSKVLTVEGEFKGWVRRVKDKVEFKTFKCITDGDEWIAVYSSLPPDQSARINELEEVLEQVLKSHTEEQDRADKAEFMVNELKCKLKIADEALAEIKAGKVK